jgi:ribosomal protein S19
MKKPAILLLGFLSVCTITWSQNLTGKKTAVNTSTVSSVSTSSTDLPFFSSSADAEKIVSGIMDAMGLESNFKIKVANVPNVEATIKHHERYILYNPEFVNTVNEVTKDKWASIFILAHEVGHHLGGILKPVLRRDLPLNWKPTSCRLCLCKMGATLQQAQLAIYYISNMALQNSPRQA